MTTARKKLLLNIAMIVAIVLVAVAAIMIVGNIKGWFGGDNATSGAIHSASVFAQNKIGGANIEREGVAYSLKDGTPLRDGDIIETLNSSNVDIVFGDCMLTLGENSEAIVNIPAEGEPSFSLASGEVFVNAPSPFILNVADTHISSEECIYSVSAPFGSANVLSYAGSLNIGDEALSAGNAASILADGVHKSPLAIQSLNAFNLSKITALGDGANLCFTPADVESLISERELSIREAEEAELLADEEEAQIEAQRQQNLAKQQEIKEKLDRGETLTSEEAAMVSEKKYCTIEIRCDTILAEENMPNLTEGKNIYVPANGCILATSRLSFTEGETVFEVLQRACSLAGIQLEYSWTPMYGSYYIEGINNLYEFDCGNESGWMYKVNGWFPNYGCSSYTLKDGDVIVWCYTCRGLGADVGGSVY